MGNAVNEVLMENEEREEKGGIGNVLRYSSYTGLSCQFGVTGNERDPHFCRFLHILVILAGLQAYIRAFI